MEHDHLSSPLKTALGSAGGDPKLVEKLELATVGDLLRYYPRKYDQRGKLTDLAALVVGERATVWARVVKVTERELGLTPEPAAGAGAAGVRHITKVVIGDSNRQLTCTFFNQYHWSKMLPAGHRRDVLRQGHQVQQRRCRSVRRRWRSSTTGMARRTADGNARSTSSSRSPAA